MCVCVCVCVCVIAVKSDLNENSWFYNKLALLRYNFSQGQNVLPCVGVDNKNKDEVLLSVALV